MQLLPFSCEKFTAVRNDRYASAAGDCGDEIETTSAHDDRLAGMTPMTGTLLPAAASRSCRLRIESSRNSRRNADRDT